MVVNMTSSLGMYTTHSKKVYDTVWKGTLISFFNYTILTFTVKFLEFQKGNKAEIGGSTGLIAQIFSLFWM